MMIFTEDDEAVYGAQGRHPQPVHPVVWVNSLKKRGYSDLDAWTAVEHYRARWCDPDKYDTDEVRALRIQYFANKTDSKPVKHPDKKFVIYHKDQTYLYMAETVEERERVINLLFTLDADQAFTHGVEIFEKVK